MLYEKMSSYDPLLSKGWTLPAIIGTDVKKSTPFTAFLVQSDLEGVEVSRAALQHARRVADRWVAKLIDAWAKDWSTQDWVKPGCDKFGCDRGLQLRSRVPVRASL